LGTLTVITPFSIDMYLPAFQKIADQFGSTPARVSLSLSSYFVGLAIGQIAYGPLLDRYGRRPPLFFGLIIYVLSSLMCVMVNSVDGLIGARGLQALGGCVAGVASTAMVRDFFSPEDGAKVFSRLMLILSVSPLFAPTVGGWIVSLWGWKAVFYVLAAVAAVVTAIIYVFLPEPHTPDPSVSLSPLGILRAFREVITNRQFFEFAVSGAFSFAGLFTYLAGAPSIFIGTFHVSERGFGLIFAFLSIGMIGGSQVNVWLTRLYRGETIFAWALSVQVVAALIYLLLCHFIDLPLAGHIAILFIYISSVGLVYPNGAALSLAPFSKNTGSASALLGLLQTGVGSLAAAAFGFLPFQPATAVALVFLLGAVVAWSIFRWCACCKSLS
jgi:DHA1 family bicyclomycin/chloramphenicol resistance-like MFS transporter